MTAARLISLNKLIGEHRNAIQLFPQSNYYMQSDYSSKYVSLIEKLVKWLDSSIMSQIFREQIIAESNNY